MFKKTEKLKRKWDLISKEKRNSAINEIIAFFDQERGEQIGLIAAEELLDFFLQNLAEDIYRKGIEDSKNILKRRFEDLELDLDVLGQ